MRILWLCNIMPPQIAKSLGFVFRSTNGWIDWLSIHIAKDENVDLTVMFPIDKHSKRLTGTVEEIDFESFFLDSKHPDRYCKEQEKVFEEAILRIKPEVVHIWGSEYPHTLAMVRACEKQRILPRVIISVQGLISACAYHYYAGLPEKVLRKRTFRDLLKRDGFKEAKRKFEIRGQYEEQALKMVEHVFGRTEWDFACVKKINPNLTYHYCNEILREGFYEGEWKLSQCKRHTIFVSQWGYPIKGFHQVLEALKEIKKNYPDVQLITTGKNPFQADAKERIRQGYYEIYIMQLIKKWELQNQVFFLGGELKEEEMKTEYLKAHIFVVSSAIENSPNSLGEAMLLGTPVIASDVGGISSLATHGKETFLYPYDEPYMLAHYIERIFEADDLADNLSKAEKERASRTHDRYKNMYTYIETYSKICTGVDCKCE